MEFVTYFVTNYGYLAIFLLLAPGTFGIPVPDELLLTFLGYLVLRGDLRLIPTLAVVVAGASLGITLDYWVGRAAGARLIREAGASPPSGLTSFRACKSGSNVGVAGCFAWDTFSRGSGTGWP